MDQCNTCIVTLLQQQLKMFDWTLGNSVLIPSTYVYIILHEMFAVKI